MMGDSYKKNWKELTNSEKNITIIVLCIIALILFWFVSSVAGFMNNNSFSNTTESTQINHQTTGQEKTTPQKYEELDTFLRGDIAANKHYLYMASAKPSYDDVKAFIIEETKKGCGSQRTVCEYYLWDDEDAYEQAMYGNGDLMSGTADEIASKNKEHLSGYINSGDLVYYYGTTGDGSDDSGTIYDGAGKFVDF